MDQTEAVRIVHEAIDLVNGQLPASRRLHKSPETVIAGAGGSLDSLGIVNFVITLEERAHEVLGTPIKLFDEASLVEKNSPFQTVDTLARFLERLQ